MMQRVASTFLLVVFVSGCSKSNLTHVDFQLGKLTAAEIASIQQTVGFRTDSLTYRAVWKENGTVRHVCLQPTDSFDSFSRRYEVAVFGDNGALLERTHIIAPRLLKPSSVFQLSPLLIQFRDPTRKRKDDVKEAPSTEEWKRRTVWAYETVEAKLKEEISRLEASGTNAPLVAAVKARLGEIQDAKKKLNDR